jgi:hypothetical protein
MVLLHVVQPPAVTYVLTVSSADLSFVLSGSVLSHLAATCDARRADGLHQLCLCRNALMVLLQVLQPPAVTCVLTASSCACCAAPHPACPVLSCSNE